MRPVRLRIGWGDTLDVGDRHQPIRPHFELEVELAPGESVDAVAARLQDYVRWHWYHNAATLAGHHAALGVDVNGELGRFFAEHPQPPSLQG